MGGGIMSIDEPLNIKTAYVAEGKGTAPTCSEKDKAVLWVREGSGIFPNTPPAYSFSFSMGKELLCITPEGEIIFNKIDFPNLTANEFAKEFVECVEKITGKS